MDLSGRGAARAEDAQETPNQSHTSPSILVYEDKVDGFVPPAQNANLRISFKVSLHVGINESLSPRRVFWGPKIIHFEPSLDALCLRSDVITSNKTLSLSAGPGPSLI